MSLLLYNLFLVVYGWGLRLAARFNPKARLWVEGRRNWPDRLSQALGSEKRPLIWMHCASLGEFEQGRPLLEFIRLNFPQYRILVSFFSPSGYEVRKNYQGADIVCYLPLDGVKTAKAFVDMVQPDLVLWIRYEFWYHYLSQLKSRQVPVLLIAGLFRGTEPFFRWYGRMHRYMLGCFHQLFVQNADSASRLQKLGFNQVLVSGDTRYDRVSAIAELFQPIPLIERFVAGHPVVVAGSTWPEDEEQLDHFANSHPEYRFIIAPHEIGPEHLQEIEALFKNCIRYSTLQHQHENGDPAINKPIPTVLVIDNIGMLSKLYHYATVAYIGGGFGADGLHNILEAAVYGVPVIHGPEYERFPEAVDLLEAGGSFAVENALELEKLCGELLQKGSAYEKAAANAGRFVQERRGATRKITDYIQANRLLTN